jgi:hypothetical protein
MLATMTIEAATDGEIFLTYLDKVLCPKLKPDDVVVMGNLSSHKVTGVAERIAKVGAEVLYLPPYSRKPGLSSNNSAPQKPEPPNHSIRQSPICSQPSAPKMRPLGPAPLPPSTSIPNPL